MIEGLLWLGSKKIFDNELERKNTGLFFSRFTAANWSLE